MLHVGRAGASGFDIAASQPVRAPHAIRHRLAATASLTAIAVAAGPGEGAASGLLDGHDPASDGNTSIERAGVQPALVPVGSDATHAYFLDTPADEGAIDRRIGAAFSGDRDASSNTDTAGRPDADAQTYALTAGQRILNAFGAAPDPLSTGPKWGPYIDFIARPGTPSSTGTIDLFVPVAQADDWLVFLNARGTLTSEPSQEAGLGGGVRHIVPDFIFGQDTILGVYGFVDFRNSSNGNSFVQGTIGAELITERFEVRINGYLPGSRTYTVAGSTAAGVALQGTNVVLTNTLRQEQALPGFDVEAGLRFELDPDTTLRVNGGYYRFARGGTKVEGGLARAELQFDDPFGFDGASLSIGGELRNDNYNGTHGNATLRFRMPLGTSRNGGDEGAGFGDINDLMVRPVQRFDNILAPEVDGPTQDAGPATDVATGQTLQVFHVAQTAQGNGDCSSVQNACTFTVAQSLAGAGDTFVAVDIAGDIASAFALNAANQRVVGAGDTGTVSVPLTNALSSVLTLGGLGGRPTVAGVDFGANADPFVRGIATNTAAGIGGNGFTGTATIDDVRSTNGGLAFQNTGATINVSNSAFDGGAGIGVALTNLTGAFTMTGSTVTSTGGGFRIDGGNGTISHDGMVTQTGAASAIDIRNRTGGTVTFGGAVTANTGTATGINLLNNAGTVAFNGGLDIDTTTGTGFSAIGGGTVNVSNGAVVNSVTATAGQAIDIDGIGGSLTFNMIASTNAPGDAVAIDNFGAGATFRVTGATAITTPGEDGIDIDNVAGTVAFDGPVTVTTPTDDGVDMDDATGMVTFSGPLTVTNPGDDGIDIEDSFNATLAFNGPVTISDAGGNGIELNGPGGAAPTTGTLTFGGSTTITNPNLAGVLVADRIGTVTFSGPVTANTGAATGIDLQNNAGTIAFTGGLDIDTTTGTGFSAIGGGTVNVGNGAVVNSVTATAGQAIDIDGVGGSMTFSTIASTGAPFDAVAINDLGVGSTFRVTGATAVTTPGEDGIDIDNVAGAVFFDGPVTVTTPTDDGIDMDDVTGMVTFSGPVTVTNPGDDGIDIEDSFNATLAFNGPVAITGSGGNGIELNGPGGAAPTAGTLTFGGSTTITNPNLAGVLGADRIGAVTFADLDIALQTPGSAGLVLAGATINGNFTATDFDVTSTTNAVTAGVVLSGTMGPGTIQLGDSNVAGANASIAGVDAGVVFNPATNATFIFGDGEGTTDQGSSISATTAILGGAFVTMGSYNFDDVTFTGALDFVPGGGSNLVFVAATATGDGSGSDVNNRANVVTADAIMTANTTFVLINDGAAIDDVDGFTLSHNQTMASFGNGRTFASSGLIIPANFTGVPGAGAVINDPTGNGAATLTNTGAGDTLTALGGVTTQDFIIENTAGGDGLAGVGAIGINSTGLTIRNITAGQGIDLDNVTGTATFNNTTIATTVGNAVDIDNSTVSFTGNLDIDTTTGTGFNATGGSTVDVAAAGTQTIDSAGGVALNLNMATIGGGGFNFDTVSGTGGSRAINLGNVTTSAGNGINIGRANALNNTVQGIAIANVTGAGGVTIIAADIDNPTNSGIGITGVNTGATFSIGTGTSNGLTGLNIDGGTIGLFLSQNGADLNIGTGTGFLRIGETTAPTIVGVDNDGAAAGEALNIGNATNASRINSGGRGMDIFGRPTIAVTNLDVTNAGTEGVHLGNYGGTATFDDLTVQGMDGASNAVNIVQSSNASTLTFNDLAISNFDGGATGGGFVANISGTGSTNITFGGAGTAISSPGAAVEVNNTTGNAASAVLALDNLTLTRASAGFTLNVDGGATDGATIVTSLNGLTITGNGTSGGAQFDRVTFDAVPGGAIQQATGTGTTQIGQGVGTRVAGDGLRLNNVLGDIALGTLNVFNDSGTGLFIRDAAGKAGAFAFGNTGGVIDTTTGASVDIDPVTMSSTFASLTSTNSGGRGVNLDTIAGTFTVTGTTSVTGSTTEGVRVINSTAAVNLGTLNVSGTTGTGVLITNNGGGSFTATGGTVTKAGVGDALDINGGAMAVNFGANISHTSNGGDAVSIRGGTTGNITVSGTVANTTGGRAIDISTVTSGTVSFTGATVTDAVGIQIANVAGGANVNFSAGTTVTLNSPGLVGINLSNNAGAIAFNGAVDINNAGDSGIVLVNANANVTFGQVDIELGAGAANADAISVGGTPGTLTFGVTTITNVGGAAGQKGIDLSGANLGGAVNFESVAISGPDTSTDSIGIDLTGVLGNQIVNVGTVGVADSTTDTPSSITDLHRGVIIDNTAAVQFTFGDGFGDGAPGGPDEASTINVNGQAGAFTVDVGGGTNAASSFDFNDVGFGPGDNANLPGGAGSAVFVSQTGGVIAAGTHGLNVSTGGGLNTITVAAAEALADADQTFVFVAHTGAGVIDVTGGGADGFTLKDGQSLDGFDDGRVITFGTVQPANVEGNLGATGGNVTQNSVVASNSNGGATSIVATAAGAGNSTIRNTVFDGAGLGAGDAAISVDGAANPVTINNVEITNIGTGATGVLLNNNAGGVALTDVDLTNEVAANAGTALGIDAGGASTAAITVDAASDIDGTTGTVVSIGTGARNVTVSTNITATGNTDNVIEIASQSGGAIQFGTVTSANATGNSVIETTAQSGGTLTFGNVAITGYGNAAADVAVELFGSGGTVTFADLDIATANGAGLAATGAGLTVAATSGDFNVTGGAAVNLNGVTANTVSLTSITGNGSGTVADGIVLNNLGANSTLAVTGTTTLDNYTDAGIQIANLANNNQDIDFGATDINRNTAVATGRGIVIDSIGGTGVDIDFGATRVGQGTVTTMGILVSGVGAGAAGFDVDFASVNVTRARTGISIDNVDGGSVGVTGFARADNAQIANLTVQGSAANVTFGGTFGAQNNSGFDGRLVDIGNAAANTGTTTFVGQATITASGTAAGEGINLASGTATFNGGLNIDTVTGTGLTATGGTLNVAATGGDESITTSSGRAVQIQNTTINAVFDSITGNGGGTAANGISFVATGGGSSFAVTGTTTLNNYTAESIVLDTILSAGQTFAFGAVDINTTAGQVQAGSDGISISTISAPGVDIDFGAVTVGNATDQSDDGIRISSIQVGANDIDIDFASLALTNLDEALHIEHFDATGRTITVAGTTTIDDARTNGIRIFNSLGNVTFGGRTTILNDAAGANASGVDLGTSAGGANAGTYSFNGLDVTVNGVGAFGLRATNTGTLNITGGTNDIVSNNGTAVFINPTVTNITLRNVTSTNSTDSGVEIDLGSAGSTFTVTGTTTVTGSTNAGIHVNASDGTINFGNTVIDNTGTAGGGVLIDGAGTRTINFNGGLDIDTNSGNGFVSTAANTTLGIAAAGTRTVNTATGRILNLSNTTIAAGGVDFQSLQASGTVVADAVRINNITGGTFTVDDGNAGTANDVLVTNTSGAGTNAVELTGASTANINISSLDVNGTATDGIFLNETGTTGSVTFGTVAIDGVIGDGIDIQNQGRAISVNGGSVGSVNDPNGHALNILAGSANVTIAASLTKTTANRVVLIQGRTGGSVTVSGNLSATGGADNGIVVSSNSGGTVTFSGTTKTLNTATHIAARLTNNTGATVNFTNGGLDIDTTTGGGLTATGGGTVTIQGTNNTINTTTGRAVNINGTTIGAGGVTFQSISQNGGTNAINLNATGTGAFDVTGTGTTDGSGGTLQNVTGNAIQLTNAQNVDLRNMNLTNVASTQGAGTSVFGGNIANYNAGVKLTNVTNLTLNNLDINGNNNVGQVGISGQSVSGLTITDTTVQAFGDVGGEDNIQFQGLTGTVTITNLTNRDAGSDLFAIDNTGDGGTTAGGNLTMTVTGSTFQETSVAAGAGGLRVNVNGNGTSSVSVNTSTFGNGTAVGASGGLQGTALELNVGRGHTGTLTAEDNTFNGMNVGISGTLDSAGVGAGPDLTVNIRDGADVGGAGNTITGIRANAINLFTNGTLAAGVGTLRATITDNTIGTLGTAGSGSQLGNGIRVSNEGGSTMTVNINNNTIQETAFFEGVSASNNVTAGTSNITITNNVFREIDFDRPIQVANTIAGGTTCSNISGNSFSGTIDGGPFGAASRIIRVRQTAGTHNSVQTSGANIQAVNGGTGVVTVTGTINFGGPVCTLP